MTCGNSSEQPGMYTDSSGHMNSTASVGDIFMHAIYQLVYVACLATEYAGHPHAGKSHSRACTHNHKMIIHVEVCCCIQISSTVCREYSVVSPESIF